jgi:predicted pyridoxine 5'-phosphate oxidase superfamily flavin-nucleotide-binding protein
MVFKFGQDVARRRPIAIDPKFAGQGDRRLGWSPRIEIAPQS